MARVYKSYVHANHMNNREERLVLVRLTNMLERLYYRDGEYIYLFDSTEVDIFLKLMRVYQWMERTK